MVIDMKQKKRIATLLMAGAMLFSALPVNAWAVGQPDGLCEHHPQHTAECGYTEGSEGTPCTYICEICNPQDSGKIEETVTEGGAAAPSNALLPTVLAAGDEVAPSWTYDAERQTLTCTVDGTTIPLDNVTADSTNLTIGKNVLNAYLNNINSMDLTGTITDNAGTTYTITAIGEDAFNGYSNFTTITLPDRLKSIGDSAFSGCTGLTSITLPDSVTSIGRRAFSGCTSLTSITLPDSLESIGDFAFNGCTSLTSIDLPESLTDVDSSAFYGCSKLTEIRVAEGNTNFAVVDGVLFNANKTTLISYPAGKTGTSYIVPDTVTSIGDFAFNGAGLTSITLPANLEAVSYSTFDGCSKLAEITVAEESTNFTAVDGVLFDKEKTKLVLYPAGKTDMTYTVPETVKSIESYAFNDCSQLTSLTLLSEQPPKLGSYALYNTKDSLQILVPYGAVETYKAADGWKNHADQINANPAPAITTTNLSDGTVGTAYSQTLAATGDTPTWSVSSGTLPAGLNLAEGTGAITGTPTTTGTSTFTVTATNTHGSNSKELSITINQAQDTTAPTLTAGSTARDSETGATVKFTSSEAGSYYYSVVESGATEPNVGTSGAGTACGTTKQTISLDSLSGAGAKDIYIVVKDAAGNVSNKLKMEIPAYIAPSYGISVSPSALDFGSVTEGYSSAPAAQTVTIQNTGNQNVTVSLPTSTNYTITAGTGFTNGAATLTPNGMATFTVQSIIGLTVGSYGETLTISGDNNTSASVTLSFTVTEQSHAHEYGTEWVHNETSHWHECSCGAKKDEAAHVYDDGQDTTCNVCGYVRSVSPVTYTLTVELNGGSGTAAGGEYAAGDVIQIDAGTRANHRFTGWTSSNGGDFGNASSASTTFTMPAADTTITANWAEISSGGGGSSGGGSGSGSSSTVVARPDKDNPTTPTTAETKTVKTDSKGSIVITKSMVADAISAAQADARQNGNTANGVAVVVPVQISQNLSGIQITLKADALDKLASSGVRRFTIDTNRMADFGFTLDTLQELNRQTTGDLILKMQKAAVFSPEAKTAIGNRPVYDISLWQIQNGNETKVNLNSKTISIAIPYSPAENEVAGNLYAVYVDDTGKVEWLTKSSYDADREALVFEAAHFSVYGIGYRTPVPTFTDISGHWAEDNIIFVASRGLLSGTSETTFSPDAGTTRGMLVTALGRLAGINPDDYKTGKFTDVKADVYYAPYVSWAESLGIVTGTGETTFAPDANVTREQLAVILTAYAEKMGYTIPQTLAASAFADQVQISGWAKDAVTAMQRAGILYGKANNQFDPKGTATRAEIATVLRRFVEIIIDPQTANGWSQNDSGEWYYNQDGKPVKGWLSSRQKWYWLDKTTGKMFSGGWKQIDGKWHYFYADGQMAANTAIEGRTLGPDGAEISRE